VVRQGGAALADIEAVRPLGGSVDSDFTGTSGWRIGRIHRAEHPSVAQVSAAAAETDGPCLMAYVLDSDFAEVQYTRPGQSVRRFVLHPDIAAEYGCPVDPAEQAAAPADLERFGSEGADLRQLRAVVAGRMVFAEDTVLWLAAALGAVPLSDLAELCFGDLTTEDDLRRALGT